MVPEIIPNKLMINLILYFGKTILF